MKSTILSFLTFVLIKQVHGVRMLSGPFGDNSTSYFAVPWSEYIGNFTAEECLSIVAPVVRVMDDDILCEKLNSTYYVGKIAFIHKFSDLGEKNRQGCSLEVKYKRFIEAGARALVSWVDGDPGLTYAIHSAGAPAQFERMPLVSLGSDFNQIADAILNSSTSVGDMQLSCDEFDKLVFLYIRMGYLVVFGLVQVYYGFYGFYYGYKMLDMASGNTAAVNMRVFLVYIEAVILVFIGVTSMLGFVGDSTLSLFGGTAVGNEMKQFLNYELSGLSFWTTVMTAIYWQEMRRTLFSKQTNTFKAKFRNVFLTPIGATLSFLSLALVGVPELVLTYLISFNYVAVSQTIVRGGLVALNVAVSLPLLYYCRSFSKQLMTSSTEGSTSAGGSNMATTPSSISTRRIKRIASHLNFWLQVFAIFAVIQIVLIGTFIVVLNTETAIGSLLFIIAASLTRGVMSIAKVKGLSLMPKQKADSKKSLFGSFRDTIVGTHDGATVDGDGSNYGFKRAVSTRTLTVLSDSPEEEEPQQDELLVESEASGVDTKSDV